MRTLIWNLSYGYALCRTRADSRRITLTLGIGATTAIYTVVYATLQRDCLILPNQLMMVWSKVGDRTEYRLRLSDWKRRTHRSELAA